MFAEFDISTLVGGKRAPSKTLINVYRITQIEPTVQGRIGDVGNKPQDRTAITLFAGEIVYVFHSYDYVKQVIEGTIRRDRLDTRQIQEHYSEER